MPAYQKFALIWGCNYPGTPIPLSGCINDAQKIKSFLVTNRGFLVQNITTLYDRVMTKARMLASLDQIVLKATVVAATGQIPAVFVMYSGHGSRVAQNGNRRDLARVYGADDIDGDECLIPYDYQTAGFLLDDELSVRFVQRLPAKAQVFILTDSCNSGTNFDLPYQSVSLVNKSTTVSARIVHLAACRDMELALEVNSAGVTTTRFLQIIGPRVAKLSDFRKAMGDLSMQGNPQHPQVSVSHKLMTHRNATLFPWLLRNVTVDAPRLVIQQEADLIRQQTEREIREAEEEAAKENLLLVHLQEQSVAPPVPPPVAPPATAPTAAAKKPAKAAAKKPAKAAAKKPAKAGRKQHKITVRRSRN